LAEASRDKTQSLMRWRISNPVGTTLEESLRVQKKEERSRNMIIGRRKGDHKTKGIS